MDHGNLILTGFMGTGKSTVGRLVAARLGRPFVDSDAWIEEQAGKTVAAIFEEEGEAAFRRWEAVAAQHFSRQPAFVLATGGRLMLDPANAIDLASAGIVLCLTAPPETILSRLQSELDTRPLLSGPEPLAAMQRLLQQRAAGYSRFPALSTEGKTPEALAEEILAGLARGRWPATPLPQEASLEVTHPAGSYRVVVGQNLLPRWRRLALVEGPAALISDSHVAPLYAGHCPVEARLTIPAGEEHKNLETVRRLYGELLDAGIDRAGTLLALGGGVVGDITGFVAATYLRGIPFVQCPTSLLAMVDASVGGKTGVDLPQGKNLVGAFKQPQAVLADVGVLATLPPAEFRAGMAEVIKHGLLHSPALLAQVRAAAWSQGTADWPELNPLQSLILRAIQVKKEVVEADPFEKGERAHLNLGHTFAHAVEQVSAYRVRHGEAVAMGLAAAAQLSARLGYCRQDLPQEVEALLAHVGLPRRVPASLPVDALMAAMGRDKKKERGRSRLVLLREICQPFVCADPPPQEIRRTWQAMQAT